MFSGTGFLALVALALLDQTFAHMTLKTPVPYGIDTLDTSPLLNLAISDPQSNYPCKQRAGVYDVSVQNKIPVGVPQELTFGGSASHGGGTCQISVSLDKEPTKSSVFKLIQVFEGGCPTAGEGNDGSDQFTFTVPKGFPNGDFALAWTWYNKVGNREIYMNCAPITVTGGADNNDVYDSLPNQYLINLPTSECSTVETSDQIIPNPGQFVVKAQTNSLASATGPSCAASAAAMTNGVKGYNSIASDGGAGYGAPTGISAATPTSSAAAQATSAGVSSYNNGQYSAPATASAAPPPVSSSFTTSIIAAPLTPTSYPTLSIPSGAGVSGPAAATGTVSANAPIGTGSPSSSSGSSSSGSGNGITCDAAAHSGQYGVSVNGKTVWRAVAPGTTCDEVSAYRKRSLVLRHARVRRDLQQKKDSGAQ